MTSLTNTDLAPVIAGDDFETSPWYLFYQKGSEIWQARENSSKGPKDNEKEAASSWDTTKVAEGAKYSGSPIAAYYVKADVEYNDKSTIHLVYMDGNHIPKEKALLLDTNEWKDIEFPSLLYPALPNTSMASFSGHWGDSGHIQLLYFYIQDPQSGKIAIMQLRRGEGNKEWGQGLGLPQQYNGNILPGASMGCDGSPWEIGVYTQDHDYKVQQFLYTGGYDKRFEGPFEVVGRDEVDPSTPIAAAFTTAEQQHVFYVGTDQGKKVVKHKLGKGEPESIGDHWPGTKLGVVNVEGKIGVFYKSPTPAGPVQLTRYAGGTWRGPTQVIA